MNDTRPTTSVFRAPASACPECGTHHPVIVHKSTGREATIGCCGRTFFPRAQSSATYFWALLPGTTNRNTDALGPYRTEEEAEALSFGMHPERIK